MATATITGFGLQTGTARTIYATWYWDWNNTESYNVRWYYDTGDTNGSGTIWYIGNDSEVKARQSIYNAPSNAVRVRFVVKPIAETHKVNDNDVPYWTVSWSTEKIHVFSKDVPSVPSAPSVSIDKYVLTASLDDVEDGVDIIQFQVVRDTSKVFATGQGKVQNDYHYAKYVCNVDAGGEYQVRCRAVRNNLYSDWSALSSPSSTMPATPSGFTECYAKTSTSVYLKWNAVSTAESYDIEYTNKKEYFDGSDQTTTISGIETTRYEKTGLENGDTYFFRIRSVNGSGKSAWSAISSVVVGKKPGAPTTWSSTTTALVGESLVLYWVHNSEDGSSQVSAELEIYVNGTKETHTIQNSTDEEEKDKTSFYTVNTSSYMEGTKLQWRVRTCGVTGVYGDWSVQRTVDIYAPPTLTLTVTDSGGNTFDTLTSFPIHVSGTAGPNTQRAIGYHLTVTATNAYETVDQLGNTKLVSRGEELYSRYFDNSSELSVDLTAGNLSLENNEMYKITCVVSMNSGRTAESSLYFTVAWSDSTYFINCSIMVDKDSYVAAIQPYCLDKNRNIIDDVTLSVYRREFDGRFTEIATNVENIKNMFVSDPHPSLDYARYRIVATSKTTGYLEYYDVPAYPVGGKEAVIQWNESWTDFDSGIEDTMASPFWAGSMLKLPYNIDVSESNDPDVELIEYVGREHPVSYHGTQLGSTQTWNTDIPKDDKETIYALRRLQKWMGNAYVREPSGTGYWASVKVSFSIKHCELVIRVSLSITRVEGGI